MTGSTFRLADPPTDPRRRELWLQHVAGRLIFDSVRDYALGQLPSTISEHERAIASDAIDHAVYGLMMLIDGVTGGAENETYAVEIDVSVSLREGGRTSQQLDLRDGDGMCMGYHGWVNGNFGDDPIVAD